MATKKVKIKTREIFDEFILKNDYIVNWEGVAYYKYVIRKREPSEKINTYNHDDVLSANSDKIKPLSKVLDFITYALKRGEHDVALSQAIIKTPSSKNYDYESNVRKIIDTLIPYKKTLFEYVARPRLLENSWKELNYVFGFIDGQEERKAIFESLFQTKAFTNLDVQKEIYNMARSYLRQPQLYDKYFTKITKVDSTENVLDSVQSYSVIVASFTAEKLISSNLQTNLSSKAIIDEIDNVMKLLQSNYSDELRIVNTLMDYNSKTKKYTYNVICPLETMDINKRLIDRVINDITTLNNWADMKEFNELHNLKKILIECRAEQLKNTLNSTENNNVLTKNKIKKI